MTTIKMLSNEKNMLFRMLERYEQYVKTDKNNNDKYKNLELRDIRILYERLNGRAPVTQIVVKPPIYNFALKENRGGIRVEKKK